VGVFFDGLCISPCYRAFFTAFVFAPPHGYCPRCFPGIGDPPGREGGSVTSARGWWFPGSEMWMGTWSLGGSFEGPCFSSCVFLSALTCPHPRHLQAVPAGVVWPTR
jgi:hypothetical protein